jgi:hypothetical protein
MVNIDLKLFILQTFDSQSEAADKLGFNECRLSRLIRRRKGSSASRSRGALKTNMPAVAQNANGRTRQRPTIEMKGLLWNLLLENRTR